MTITITWASVWAVAKYALPFVAGILVGAWLTARATLQGWNVW